jgi:hypothetical protein
MDVVWTDDMSPYRTRKVRILNGPHTMTVLGAYLAGKKTVRDCLEDETIKAYLRKGIFEEIIPVLTLPRKELEKFAEEVLERFANPFIKHYLLSIALNSVAKYKARVLPTILEYEAKFGRAPDVLSWSMAALIAFYRGTEIRDGVLIGKRAARNTRSRTTPTCSRSSAASGRARPIRENSRQRSSPAGVSGTRISRRSRDSRKRWPSTWRASSRKAPWRRWRPRSSVVESARPYGRIFFQWNALCKQDPCRNQTSEVIL